MKEKNFLHEKQSCKVTEDYAILEKGMEKNVQSELKRNRESRMWASQTKIEGYCGWWREQVKGH